MGTLRAHVSAAPLKRANGVGRCPRLISLRAHVSAAPLKPAVLGHMGPSILSLRAHVSAAPLKRIGHILGVLFCRLSPRSRERGPIEASSLRSIPVSRGTFSALT